jgi:uncharacterized membrane protein YesL
MEGNLEMLSYDGVIMRALATMGNYCLLNLLWIVFSLPVITVFPATVAMFGILKEWTNGSEPPLISTFFSIFKKNFLKSSFIGVIQIVCSIIFIVDFLIIWNMEGNLKLILLPVLMLLGFIFISTSLYLYPLMAKYEMPLKLLVKKAFFLSAARPFSPLMIIVIFVIMSFICTIARFLPFVCAFSICGVINYRLVSSTIEKANKIALKTK